MNTKLLGRTGIRVSELCLGTMSFGGKGDFWTAMGALGIAEAQTQVQRAFDRGINFFDTANGYGGGEAESLLGKALGDKRRDAVVVTKAGFPVGKGPNDKGASRRHLTQALDDSLQRLGSDHVDVFMVHRRDPHTTVEETMMALGDLVRAGKARALGVSNWPAWLIMKANAFAASHALPRFEVAQMYYNLAARDLEREIVPLLAAERIALMVWSPLASGILTGKYSPDGKPPEGARRAVFDLGPIDWPRVNRTLDVARDLAKQRSASVSQIALSWLLAKPHVTSVLLGAKKLTQLDDNLGCVDVPLAPDEIARLDEASAIPAEYPGWFLAQFDEV